MIAAERTRRQTAAEPRRKLRRVTIEMPKSTMSAAINITPLVDVVLVLLILFMVVTPLLERQIDVRTPETQVSAALPSQPQLVVTLDANDRLSIDGERVTPDTYVDRLKQALEARSPEAQKVYFIAHDDSGYRTLVRAIDDAKIAGATQVGMVTD